MVQVENRGINGIVEAGFICQGDYLRKFGWGQVGLEKAAKLFTIFDLVPAAVHRQHLTQALDRLGVGTGNGVAGWYFEERLLAVTSQEEQVSIPRTVAEFGLTPVEYAVAMHDIYGKQYKQIGGILGITEGPVKTHASRCLAKTGTGSSLEMAIKGMAVGLFPLALVRRYTPPIDLEAMRRLSVREHQVLELLVQGEKNSEIASKLGIDADTVKNHVYSIYEKFGHKQTRMTLVVNFALDGYGSGF